MWLYKSKLSSLSFMFDDRAKGSVCFPNQETQSFFNIIVPLDAKLIIIGKG